MKKQFKVWSLLIASMIITAMLLGACGDATNTPGAAGTTAAATGTTAAKATGGTTVTGSTTVTGTTASGSTTVTGTTAAGSTTVTGTTAAKATTAAGTTAAAGTGAAGTARIYSSLPMTGSSREQILTLINAMQLALDDFTGGTKKIGDLTIDFVPLDDATAAKGQWDADQEKANANKAVNDPDTLVYIGTFNSGAAKVSLPILNQAGIAMISPANTNTCLTIFDAGSGCDKSEPDVYYPNKVRNYFRLAARDDLQGQALAKFVKSLNLTKVYVIDDSQTYGKGLADGFSTAAKAAGLELIARDSIGGKESDYKSLAATIKSKNPDAIFFGGITQQQAGKLLADIRAAGIKAPFFGGEGILEDAFIKDGGVAAEGSYATIAGALEKDLGPKAQDVLKRYRAKYGNSQAYTIFGYEIMSVTLTAIKNAGVKDKAAVIKALSNIKDFDGVLGKWSFDANGDISLSTFVVNQVKDGKWVEQVQVSVAK